MRGQTANRVIECVADTIGLEHVEPSMHLSGQLCVDSLDRCNIVLKLEETFIVKISDRDAENWQTVSDIISTIERQV